jgi:hypothetical protein
MLGVELRLGSGLVRVGREELPVSPVGTDGSIRLGAEGPVLRPLAFDERSSLVRAASRTAAPVGELTASVARASSGGASAGEGIIAAVALKLAGAGSCELGFPAVAALLARQMRWSPDMIGAALAAEADAMAESWWRAVVASEDGWTKVVFQKGDGAAGQSPDEIAEILAASLLDRLEASPEAMLRLAGIDGPATETGQNGIGPYRHRALRDDPAERPNVDVEAISSEAGAPTRGSGSRPGSERSEPLAARPGGTARDGSAATGESVAPPARETDHVASWRQEPSADGPEPARAWSRAGQRAPYRAWADLPDASGPEAGVPAASWFVPVGGSAWSRSGQRASGPEAGGPTASWSVPVGGSAWSRGVLSEDGEASWDDPAVHASTSTGIRARPSADRGDSAAVRDDRRRTALDPAEAIADALHRAADLRGIAP